MKKMKRVLSIFLAVLMIVLAVPISNLAGLDLFPRAQAAYKLGDHINFGTYPQSRVKTASLISNLDAVNKRWVSYDYYNGTQKKDGTMHTENYMQFSDFFYQGTKYRAVKFTKYRQSDTYHNNGDGKPGSSNQGDNGYFINNIYYFIYETLSWRVLNPSTGLVMCEPIIDSQAYNNTIYEERSKYYIDSRKNYYANDYSQSSIRRWLNYDFLESSFTDTQKNNIKVATVSNSYSGSFYSDETINDKIFLISYNTMKNSSYDFSTDQLDYDTARRGTGTEYAQCQGLGSCNYNSQDWWVRTNISYQDSNLIPCVDIVGSFNFNCDTTSTDIGVRPFCYLKTLKNDTTVSPTLFSDMKDGVSESFNPAIYGWPVPNTLEAFSENKDYDFTFTDYVSTFGYCTENFVDLFQLVTNKITGGWHGNCFGMTASAGANLIGKINLKENFPSRNGSYLSEFGYTTSTSYDNQQILTLRGNDASINLIERLQLSQFSADIVSSMNFGLPLSTEHYQWSKFLTYLKSGSEQPVVINLKNHARLACASWGYEKVQKAGQSYYKIPIYNPNYPVFQNNALSNPWKKSYNKECYLFFNPDNDIVYEEIGDEEKEYTRDAIFYEVSKINNRILNGKLPLQLMEDVTKILLGGKHIKIVDPGANKTLLEIVNGKVITLADVVSFIDFAFDGTETGTSSGIFRTEKTNLIIEGDKDSVVIAFGKEKIIGITATGDYSATLDISKNRVTFNAKENQSYNFMLDNTKNETQTHNSIGVKGTAKTNETNSFGLNNSNVIETDAPSGKEVKVTIESNEYNQKKSFSLADVALINGTNIIYYAQEHATDQPTNEDTTPKCPWCGGEHVGFFQGIVGFFHRIFAAIFGARF